MSIKSASNALTRLTRDLMIRWDDTTRHWNDAKRHEFEKKFLEPLPDAVQSTGTVIEELDRMLTKIRRDCE